MRCAERSRSPLESSRLNPCVFDHTSALSPASSPRLRRSGVRTPPDDGGGQQEKWIRNANEHPIEPTGRPPIPDKYTMWNWRVELHSGRSPAARRRLRRRRAWASRRKGTPQAVPGERKARLSLRPECATRRPLTVNGPFADANRPISWLFMADLTDRQAVLAAVGLPSAGVGRVEVGQSLRSRDSSALLLSGSKREIEQDYCPAPIRR